MLLCAFGGFVARTAARLKDSTVYTCTVRQHAVSSSEAVATADSMAWIHIFNCNISIIVYLVGVLLSIGISMTISC
jgi:hypothetical protein